METIDEPNNRKTGLYFIVLRKIDGTEKSIGFYERESNIWLIIGSDDYYTDSEVIVLHEVQERSTKFILFSFCFGFSIGMISEFVLNFLFQIVHELFLR